MRDDFAVFILSHGRPDKVETLKTIERDGYTGRWYVVIDDEDDTADAYREKFGDKVIQFNKKKVAEWTDTADLSEDRRAVIYARNVCFELAKEMGLLYFLELDDDYKSFQHRWADDGKLKVVECSDLDALFCEMIDFLESSGALTVAFGQGGDYIGGCDGGFYWQKLKRKAMNTFFCTTQRPFKFVGRINEDVNTYTCLGNKGKLFFSVSDVCITQERTQSNSGGMTELYLDIGTYTKSFYSVIFSPQAVKIATMGGTHKRVHHLVQWDVCVPMILSEKWKKSIKTQE